MDQDLKYITSIQIGFPIKKFDCAIAYSIPRKPTVFEWGIIELTERFGNDNNWRSYTLEKIFGEILGVPEVDKFVQPSLDKLIKSGFLKCGVAHSPLAEVKIKDLTLTDLGRKMLENKVMHGPANQLQYFFYYDPIRECPLPKEELDELLPSGSDKCLEVEIKEIFPEKLIRDQLRMDPPEGLSSQQEIQNIVCEETSELWKLVDTELLISQASELHLQCSNHFYKEYFNRYDSEKFYHTFLGNLFTQGVDKELLSNIRPAVMLDIYESVETFFAPNELDLNIKLTTGVVHFLRYQPYLDNHFVTKSNTLLVVFEHLPPEYPMGLNWDKTINGGIIYLDERFLLNNCYYLNSMGNNLFINLFEVKIFSEIRTIPLGYSLNETSPEIEIAPFYELLEEIIDQSDEVEHQLIKLFWKTAPEVWEATKNRIIQKYDDPFLETEQRNYYRGKIEELKPGELREL